MTNLNSTIILSIASLFFVIPSNCSKHSEKNKYEIEAKAIDYSGPVEFYEKKILLTDLNEQPLIQYFVFPSFDSEYLLNLSRIENEYYLVSVQND